MKKMERCKGLTFGLALIFLGMVFPAKAQDTVWVNTLNFDDITKRRGTYQFPTDTDWGKVRMHYTLKCDPRTTRDNFDCGEWDYLSYTIVHDSTGKIDSNRLEHPNFKIGDQSPEVFRYSKMPATDYWSGHQYFRKVQSVISSDSFLIGLPFGFTANPWENGRRQYLYTSKQLSTLGMQAGELTGVSFIFSAPGQYKDVKIRCAQVNTDSLGEFLEADFVTVFEGDLVITQSGKHTIQFLEPLNYDGTSSILFEFLEGESASGNLEIEITNLPFTAVEPVRPRSLYETKKNGFIEVQSADEVFQNLDSVISIAFWAKGDASLPKNTSIIEGKNASGTRILNIHHPWQNGIVYWDAGNDGGGYDRIQKAGNNAFKNDWNHWVFVKNTSTGSMKIYLNGSLWHSGTGKGKSMKGITSFRIGKGITNYQYEGKIDDISIWNTELDEATIKTWMYEQLSNSHPDYGKLMLHFDFETYHASNPYELVSTHDINVKGYMLGEIGQRVYAGEDYHIGGYFPQRPILELHMANQTTILDSVAWTKPLHKPMYGIQLFDDITNPTMRTGIDYGFEAGQTYTYNTAGEKIDSAAYAPQNTLNKVLNPYYQKFEVVNNVEIARYITPYGIGLDLGPDGFRWIYDVTDYASLLNGQVTLSAGNQQELIDLRFEFIRGTPAREVKHIDYYINRNSKQYKAIAADEHFKADTFDLVEGSETYKLITRITGHGHHGNSGNGQIHCCEWADKQHHLLINGEKELEWDIWQNDECALNPVSDQGGNWAPPRAGWCPGAPVPDYNFELTEFVNGDELILDYGIEPVPESNPNQGNGNYVVSMHLVQYGPINFENDAEIIDIISPTNWEYHLRENPTCAQPKIVLKNRGKNPLKGVLLKYGVVGGNPIEFYWQGDLAFEQSEAIELPFEIWDYVADNKNRRFFAEVVETNGKADEYAPNNRYETNFEIPRVATTEIEVMFKNNDIEDATVTITDSKGNTVYEKTDAARGVLNRETIYLNPGCYKLECETENGFGLNYPLIPEVSGGILRLRHPGGLYTQSFNPDFGKTLTYYFTVSFGLDAEVMETRNVEVFPNPSSGVYQVLFTQFEPQEPKHVEVLDASGALVFQQDAKGVKAMAVDLSNCSKGVYFMQVYTSFGVSTKKLIKQ
jgi:hypothetical protein